jgi:external thioesterase TEII
MIKPQLFLLHFAGGNSYSFQFMRDHLPEFDFQPLELPGRGKRIREKLLIDLDEVAADICSQVVENLKTRFFLIYGHSMGATIALKVTAMLEQKNILPLHMIVSGNPGPGIKLNKQRYKMTTEELKQELKDIGGIQEEVLLNKEFFDFLEPIFKADFEVAEKNDPELFMPVTTPIYSLMGNEEEYADLIGNWKNFALSGFQSKLFQGNHFFIYDHAAQVSGIIRQCYLDVFKEP